jgi:hypothetical protein
MTALLVSTPVDRTANVSAVQTGKRCPERTVASVLQGGASPGDIV